MHLFGLKFTHLLHLSLRKKTYFIIYKHINNTDLQQRDPYKFMH